LWIFFGFGLTLPSPFLLKVVFFGLLYHNSFFNILRKNILITCCCFAAVAIGADWMGSVG
jgi:hypothetical protein